MSISSFAASPEEHILIYRENLESLQSVEDNISALKILVAEVSGQAGAAGSLFGVSTTMTWAIVIIVVVGIALLMILLVILLRRHQALEEHISPNKKLKPRPINVKDQAKKIKGSIITYFLPPFGKPLVDFSILKKWRFGFAAGFDSFSATY